MLGFQSILSGRSGTSNGSVYMSATDDSVSFTNNRRRSFTAVVMSLMAVLMILGIGLQAVDTTHSGANSSTGSLVRADSEDDYKKEVSGLANSYVQKDDDGKTSLFKTIDKADGENDPNNFGYVVRRLFSTGYINQAADATNNGKEFNCGTGSIGAGTPYYHNCDVPNFYTEAMQGFLDPFISTGPQNAEVANAKGGLLWVFDGVPDSETLPEGGAPVKESERASKYTGLELFGYNLRYTNYLGEWDNIKVMSSARSLSNFGFMDSLKLGATAVVKGVVNGVQTATSNAINRLSTGNILGAIGNFWTDFAGGASAAAVKVIMDTSDQNVFNNWAWYRVGYGATLYNARELTAEEVAAKAKQSLYNLILGSEPDKANAPDELKNLKKPDPPTDEKSKCLVRSNGENKEQKNANETGITEGECKLQANTLSPDGKGSQVKSEKELKKDGDYYWQKSGNSKKQTLKEWVAANKATFDTAKKYGMEFTTEGDESQRDNIVNTILSEWDTKYNTALSNATGKEQEKNNSEWIKNLFTTGALAALFGADPSQNYNAPWNRFVCTNSDGTDMRDENSSLVYAFDHKGNHNPKCGYLRPPIQDGLFGNGYPKDDTTVHPDTRRTRLNTDVLSNIFPPNVLFDNISSFWLGVATSSTMVSNEVMSWSFSPLLSQLGLTDIVVNAIKYMRDSIFFPLIVLMVMLTAISAIWSAAVKKDFRQQFINLAMTVVVICSGTLLMTVPARVVKAVDTIPAQVEQTIVGTIFSAGNNATDELCTATGTNTTDPGTDLNDNPLTFNAAEGTRSLMCENWRSFAFNPWLFGQFGTNYNNLYAKESGKEHAWENSNDEIVGDAGVNMGGSITEQNWGLYQVKTMTSGTAYFNDNSKPTGSVSRDFYRIVDAQAGPGNGSNSYTRFFDNWSGVNYASRAGTAFLGGLMGILGAWTVIAFSAAKVQLTFISTMMLLIMPFMFLIGILSFGRRMLKGYIGTITGLMVQRVALVTMLAVMFRVLASVGTASSSYISCAMFSAAVCVLFLMFRKQVEEMIFTSTSGAFNAPTVADRFRKDPGGFVRSGVPGMSNGSFVKNRVDMVRRGAVSATAGGIGGVLTGTNPFRSAHEASRIERQKLGNQQRRRGFKGLDTFNRGMGAGQVVGSKQLDNDEYASALRDDILTQSKLYKDYEKAEEYYNSLPEREDFNEQGVKEVFRYNPATGQKVERPVEPTFQDVEREMHINLPGKKIKRLSKQMRAEDTNMIGTHFADEPKIRNKARNVKELVDRETREEKDENKKSSLERSKDKEVKKMVKKIDKTYKSSKEDWAVDQKQALGKLRAAAIFNESDFEVKDPFRSTIELEPDINGDEVWDRNTDDRYRDKEDDPEDLN